MCRCSFVHKISLADCTELKQIKQKSTAKSTVLSTVNFKASTWISGTMQQALDL